MLKIIPLALALIFSVPAFAGSQQEKMKACNTDAAGKKGDERKAFMKTCLSAAPASAAVDASAPSTPQARMKKCNVDAKGKKGPERKAFMSSCLKSS